MKIEIHLVGGVVITQDCTDFDNVHDFSNMVSRSLSDNVMIFLASTNDTDISINPNHILFVKKA